MRAVGLRVSRACALATAILCIFVPAAPAACAGADAAPAPGTTGPALLPYVVATACVLDEVRAANGLDPLTLDRRLTTAAYWHAVDMTAHHVFDHAGSDGRRAAARALAQGYGAGAESWAVGETLAWGEPSVAAPREIVDAWLASPEHRPVVLDPGFRDVGIMVLPAAPLASALAGVTYVADFGAERTAPPRARRRCRRGTARRRARCARTARRRAALQATARA